MKVLVTGGAGYIGSHVARAMVEAGHEVVLLDDLSTGHRDLAAGLPLVEASLLDRPRVAAALAGVGAVAHLAGAALVPESLVDPLKYWRINLAGGLTLVEEMARAGVPRMVFSSTCAVYGTPDHVPMDEDTSIAPISPYGASKAAFERVLRDVGASSGLRSIAFRYFNAAGAHGRGDIGERHEPETHLVPIVLDAMAGRRERIVVHGTDYPTPDGTCVRDYVDVRDIASAHVLALESMASAGTGGDGSFVPLNLGHGIGHSVREVIAACERTTGRKAPVEEGPRRPGDPPELVARADRAREVLGWTPRHGLDDMVSTAWRFHQRLSPS